jgi:purine-nucleoside phosphorylase
MQQYQSAIHETSAFLKSKGMDQPVAGIVLGTGLGSFINHIEVITKVPYNEIPNFPEATVESHKGVLLYGVVNGVKVIAMQGRFHFYEGYSMQQITFPVRVMKELGIRFLLLSNASGGLNPLFKKGDMVITEDHINLLSENPLRGLGDKFGNRFVDMSRPYDAKLQQLVQSVFEKENIPVKKGIYVSVMGPNLETRAEYRWLRSMGADMVGMSTVPEVIVANQLELPCAAVSVITDECDPDNLQPVNISEIIEVAGRSDKKLSAVFKEVVGKLVTGY